MRVKFDPLASQEILIFFVGAGATRRRSVDGAGASVRVPADGPWCMQESVECLECEHHLSRLVPKGPEMVLMAGGVLLSR